METCSQWSTNLTETKEDIHLTSWQCILWTLKLAQPLTKAEDMETMGQTFKKKTNEDKYAYCFVVFQRLRNSLQCFAWNVTEYENPVKLSFPWKPFLWTNSTATGKLLNTGQWDYFLIIFRTLAYELCVFPGSTPHRQKSYKTECS